MPDFERVFDDLRVDLATTPEEKASALGFIAGKAYARKEMAILVTISVAVIFYGIYITQ